MPVHVILECLASIDENYRHLIVVLATQFRVGIDIYLAPLEVRLALDLRKGLLDYLAKMTSFARIHHYVVHLAIVNPDVYRGSSPHFERALVGAPCFSRGELDFSPAEKAFHFK
jgi:hypothetical protein